MTLTQQTLCSILSATIRNKAFFWKLNEKIDWEALYTLAKRHEVETLIYPILQKSESPQLPSEVLMESWRKSTLIEGLKQDLHMTRIRDVFRAFNQSKIQVVALKGLLLRDLYAHPELRSMGDADLFLHREDIDRAKNVLSQMGYREVPGPDPKHRIFEHPHYHRIELHWTFVNPDTVVNTVLFESAIWQNVNQVDMCGVPVLSLSYEDHVVFLILHMVNHFLFFGFGLRNLCDLVLLIESKQNQLNWTDITQKLKDTHTEKFAQVLLITCERLLGLDNSFLLSSDTRRDDCFLDEFQQDIFSYDGGYQKDFTRQMVVDKLSNEKRNNPRGSSDKWKFMIQTLFPRLQDLEARYTYAQNYPLLYPFALIHRLLRGIFSRKLVFGNKWKLLATIGSTTQKRREFLEWLNLF
jgi:hypothetical protein